jgi:hypothetical protein
VIKQNVLTKEFTLNTIIFANDQVTVACAQYELRRAAQTLNNIAPQHILKISISKTKAMVMKGKMNGKIKIVINNNIIEKRIVLIVYNRFYEELEQVFDKFPK